MIDFNVIQLRRPGGKKLTKPKELRGISRSISLSHSAGRSVVQVFIDGNDIYLRYNDYYSPSIEVEGLRIGTPIELRWFLITGKKKLPKFIYGDSWGDVVARQEAWVKVTGLVDALSGRHNDVVNALIMAEADYHGWDYVDMLVSETQLLFDDLVTFLKKHFNVSTNHRYLRSL